MCPGQRARTLSGYKHENSIKSNAYSYFNNKSSSKDPDCRQRDVVFNVFC